MHKQESLLNELIDAQEKKLLQLARRINPRVTSDDILQPQDFPELEGHPEFRYEEGYLHALKAMQAAFRS